MNKLALSLLALSLALMPLLGMTQQTPLTGRMMDRDSHSAGVRNPSTVPAAMPFNAPIASQSDNDSMAPATSLPTTAAIASAAALPVSTSGYRTDAAPAAIGDTVRQLFQMQANDQRPGDHLPVLGDEASASYRRYLKSFEHDIPEFYEAKVAGNGANGSAGN